MNSVSAVQNLDLGVGWFAPIVHKSCDFRNGMHRALFLDHEDTEREPTSWIRVPDETCGRLRQMRGGRA